MMSVSLALTVFAGCGVEGQGDEQVARNLLWIVVDTLRADRVGCYGYERETTPAMDALAARGVRFDRAYASAPWTNPSVTSMLTGRIASSHGVYRTDRMLPEGMDSLPRQLAAEGFRTLGIVSNMLIGKWNGFDEHFEQFDERFAKGESFVSTNGVVELAHRWLGKLKQSDDRFLLFVHLFDPHVQYQRHPEIGFAAERGGLLTGEEPYRVLRKSVKRMGKREQRFLGDLYDEEVRFTDDGIARLLEGLESLDLADSTLVVLTADHGEEILDRGWIGHTRTLFDELVRVPLIFAGPGVPAGQTVDEPVSLIELPRALRELLGVESLEDKSRLAARVLGEETAAPALPVVCEVDFIDERNREKEAHLSAIISGDFKLIREESSGELNLYDLAHDPLELTNLAKERAQQARKLAALLDNALARLASNPLAPNTRELDREQLDALEGLGYVGGESE